LLHFFSYCECISLSALFQAAMITAFTV